MENEVDNIVKRCVDFSGSTRSLEFALSAVFRALLSNLIRDFNNPKFRKVRLANKFIASAIKEIPEDVAYNLFHVIGFRKESTSESSDTASSPPTSSSPTSADAEVDTVLVFNEKDGSILAEAEKVLSSVEEAIARKKRCADPAEWLQLQAQLDKQRRDQVENARQQEELEKQRLRDKIQRDRTEREERVSAPLSSDSSVMLTSLYKPDFDAVKDLLETARRTLLHTGRVRNTLFEGKHFTLRRMEHGRVYACKEACGNDYLEAHWHLITAKNTVYAYLAHLNADATKMIHLGVEHGYQYGSVPGSSNFRKVIHFTEKKIAEDGSLEHLEHPNDEVTCCIYCGVPFSTILL